MQPPDSSSPGTPPEPPRAMFTVLTVAGDPLTDNMRLAMLCDRLRIVDPATGQVVWEPSPGATLDSLRFELDRWALGERWVQVDPANPLSYLLVECVCRPHQVVNCPVHGPRRLGKRPYRRRGEPRPDVIDRRREVAALVEREGSLAAAARVLGISCQRVRQILRGKKARPRATGGNPHVH